MFGARHGIEVSSVIYGARSLVKGTYCAVLAYSSVNLKFQQVCLKPDSFEGIIDMCFCGKLVLQDHLLDILNRSATGFLRHLPKMNSGSQWWFEGALVVGRWELQLWSRLCNPKQMWLVPIVFSERRLSQMKELPKMWMDDLD